VLVTIFIGKTEEMNLRNLLRSGNGEWVASFCRNNAIMIMFIPLYVDTTERHVSNMASGFWKLCPWIKFYTKVLSKDPVMIITVYLMTLEVISLS